MGEFIYDRQPELIAWAREAIGFGVGADVKAIGWSDAGRLRAVTLYENFTTCDCNIHIASDGTRQWLRRPFLAACFMHPFVQWQLRRLTGLVPSKNADAIRFNTNLGFRREGFVRHALPDDDIVLMGMLRAECRFIPAEFRSDP